MRQAASLPTFTEFLAKEVASKYLESPYYRLTGVIKEIVKEEYGNFYFKEEASETFVYVYGLTKAPVAKNDKSFASLGLKVGDKVITSKYSGTEVKVDGEECTIVRQSDILAIVE